MSASLSGQSSREEDEALPCLECGYDLRATRGAHCPECGVAFDAAQLRGLWLPWDQQRGVLRPWLFLRTAWAVVAHFRGYRRRIGGPTSLRRARWFRAWVGLLLVVVVGCCWAMGAWASTWFGLWWWWGGLRPGLGYGAWSAPRGWLETAAWIGLMWWVWSVAGVHVWAFARLGRDMVQAERAWATGLYLSAAALLPLVVAPLIAAAAGICTWAVLSVLDAPSVAGEVSWKAVAWAAWVAVAAGLLGAWAMQGVAAAKATGRGWGYAVLVALLLPVAWALLMVLVALPPLLVGYVHAIWWSYASV